jgi:hypothetical protein
MRAPTAKKTNARLEVSPAAIPPDGAEVGVEVPEEVDWVPVGELVAFK